MTPFISRSDVTSWGQVLRFPQFVAEPSFRRDLDDLLRHAPRFEKGLLARGLGRSYGDSNLNQSGGLIDCSGLDRLIAFDAESGVLRAEAGVSLARILDFALPRGFFLPVTPGTKFVSLAGAIANDVHGKNHGRAGTFGCWVEEISLLRSDGSRLRLCSAENPELFAATIGGLGLTGIITEAAIRLRPVRSSMVDAETIAFSGVSDFFSLSRQCAETHEHAVAWIDCLAGGRSFGRGLFTRGNHAETGSLFAASRKTSSLRFDMPAFVLNRRAAAVANAARHLLGRRRTRSRRVSWDAFFYPLDAFGNWNRLYGARGFFQHQSVVPAADAPAATEEMLRQVAGSAERPLLAVAKTFGAPRSPGLLSFPMEGATLSFDFANRGASTLALLDRLDGIVREAGGRLYPAKDGRASQDMLRRSLPQLERFRSHVDPLLSSSLWRRVEGR